MRLSVSDSKQSSFKQLHSEPTSDACKAPAGTPDTGAGQTTSGGVMGARQSAKDTVMGTGAGTRAGTDTGADTSSSMPVASQAGGAGETGAEAPQVLGDRGGDTAAAGGARGPALGGAVDSAFTGVFRSSAPAACR
jgi:hypothetical protein